MSTTTTKPPASLLPVIICDELASLGLRSEEAGRHWDATIARMALALLAPTADAYRPETPPAPAPEEKPKRGRKPRANGVPASVADLPGAKP